MKRLALVAVLAALACSGAALAQTTPYAAPPAPSARPSPGAAGAPQLPQLDATQQAEVQRQMDLYRSEVDGRVQRGEITGDEANRLLRWREWQITQQVAGLAPPPGPIYEEAPAPVVREYYRPYPYYVPYYGPAYYAPAPYYWGARICAGGFGHHFGGRFCF